MMSEARHHCRRCRLKLAEPMRTRARHSAVGAVTANITSATAKPANGRWSASLAPRKSATDATVPPGFENLKRHHLLGRHQAPVRVNLASRTPIKQGVGGGGQGRPTYRIVAGSLTPLQLRLATIGAAFGNCPFQHDRKLNRKHWDAAERAPIEAGGYFTEPEWRDVVSTDGVKCFVTSGKAP
jgi:hypothetical protein